jgi:hypothetical protein
MPRSGTTVIFEAFATHPELGWLSNYSNRFPRFPQIAAIHRLFLGARGRKNQDDRLPLLRRLLPEPSESYTVWEGFFGPSFSYSFLANQTPTPAQTRNCQTYMRRLLAAEGKSRLCVKFTGPPRKRFLEQVFPSALFVNVIRDPKAVVASLLSVEFWKARGLDKPFWDGGLTSQELAIWEQSGRSAAALAALLWCAVCRATERETATSARPVLSVRYEHYMKDPIEEIKHILSFSDLEYVPHIEEHIRTQSYRDMNFKFTQRLSAKDVDLVDRITEPYRKVFGY